MYTYVHRYDDDDDDYCYYYLNKDSIEYMECIWDVTEFRTSKQVIYRPVIKHG